MTMTPEQINEAVAVHVFGEARPEIEPIDGMIKYLSGVASTSKHWHAIVADATPQWQPTDFLTGDGMLAVLEKVKDMGHDVDISDDFGREWLVAIGTRKFFDDSLPKAVALAALAAVGQGVGDG